RVCHLDAEAGLSQLLRVKTAGDDDAENPPAAAALSRMDQACIQCHPTMELHLPEATGLALPKVSSELSVVHASACASCHREHVGRARMALPDRATCVACHDN